MELGCGTYEDLCGGYDGIYVKQLLVDSMFYEFIFLVTFAFVLNF